jgi:hypothetical protein
MNNTYDVKKAVTAKFRAKQGAYIGRGRIKTHLRRAVRGLSHSSPDQEAI